MKVKRPVVLILDDEDEINLLWNLLNRPKYKPHHMITNDSEHPIPEKGIETADMFNQLDNILKNG